VPHGVLAGPVGVGLAGAAGGVADVNGVGVDPVGAGWPGLVTLDCGCENAAAWLG